MHSEYKNLVKDVISFVKTKSPLFFEEAFLIKAKPIQQNYIQNNIAQKKTSLTTKTAPANKPPQSIKEKPQVQTPSPIKPSVKSKKTYLDKAHEIPSNFDHFKDIRQLITKIDHNFELRKAILDDNIAKKIACKWQYKLNAYPVTILTASKDERELNFLQSIAKAINIYFFEAKVVVIDAIEKENQWDEFLKSENIRLILAVDDQIWGFKNLMQHFKEIPNQSSKTLGPIPLFLIPNLKLYFQNFRLKKSLWKALCQTIAEL